MTFNKVNLDSKNTYDELQAEFNKVLDSIESTFDIRLSAKKRYLRRILDAMIVKAFTDKTKDVA